LKFYISEKGEAMDSIWNFITQNLNYILLGLAVVFAYLIGRSKSISGAVGKGWDMFVVVIIFFADAIREQDGDKIKTSFSRILGIYVTCQIVAMGWVALLNPMIGIPAQMMTLFWVTIGYALISKVFTTASPLLQSTIAAWLAKNQNFPPLPKVPETTKTTETKITEEVKS